ncbi:MAG: hypothetical protein AB4911_25405 [Oscillochloridaceae bacterium umkhey_bin13]
MKITLDLELLAEKTGLTVRQHQADPTRWVAGLGKGDVGPFDGPEAALIAAVGWLVNLARDAHRDQALLNLGLGDDDQADDEYIAAAYHAAAALTRIIDRERRAKDSCNLTLHAQHTKMEGNAE